MTTAQQYDVSDLAEFMQRAKDANKPYVFFTGAGCSKTAGIPLAGELIAEMQKHFWLELKPLSADDREDYGKCMAQIGRDDRRKFLKDYIDKANINWAHIALASLLDKGYISRVLTFNFDNLLARSCGLLGLYPATYDLTSADLNLYRLIDNPAVVHLHGQSHGFAQLNSGEETKHHAEKLSSFISDTLTESPTLFIGYSGKADAFFPKIQEKYSGQHPLFWVDMSEQAPGHIAKFIATTKLAHYMRCTDGADLFLIELARELKCFPPTIFTDPYSHMIEELSAVVTEYPISVKKECVDNQTEFQSSSPQQPGKEDILAAVIKRLKIVQQQERNNISAEFLQLFLEGNYEQVISQANNVQDLNEEDSQLLARSYFECALKQSDLSEEMNIYEALIQRFGNSTEAALQEQVAMALVNKGVRLVKLNRSEEAISVYDEVVQRFGDSTETTLQERVAKALMNKDITLGQLNRSEEAIPVYDEVVQRFGNSTETTLQERVAMALVNQGITLKQLNRSEEAIPVYDEVVQRFGNSTETALQQQVAMALVNKGITLGQLNRSAEEIKVYDEAVQRFGNSSELALQEQVAMALVNKGFRLGQLNRPEEENQLYDEVVQRFGNSAETALQQQVAMALVNKGFRLGQLNRSAEEITVYDEAVQRFGDSTETALQEQVAKALVNKGVRLKQLNRAAEEIPVYDEVVQRFGNSTETVLQEQVAKALVSKGITLGQLNRLAEEITVYDEVVQRFGNSTETVLQQQVAMALVNKGVRLGQLNSSAEEIPVYDEVVQRFGDSTETALQEAVAMALVNKGITLEQLNRSAEEIQVYDEVVQRFGESEDPTVQEQVAKARKNRSLL